MHETRTTHATVTVSAAPKLLSYNPARSPAILSQLKPKTTTTAGAIRRRASTAPRLRLVNNKATPHSGRTNSSPEARTTKPSAVCNAILVNSGKSTGPIVEYRYPIKLGRAKSVANVAR